MQRRVEIKSGSEWISLTEVETDEKPIVEDVKTDAFFLFSVFGICWCVTAIFVVYV